MQSIIIIFHLLTNIHFSTLRIIVKPGYIDLNDFEIVNQSI